ncbi:hypothetical protein N8703_04685, partial [Verrucomicrobia bacterium]|nr:hypothetical protein [Verrucomicrobiota bacterium]
MNDFLFRWGQIVENTRLFLIVGTCFFVFQAYSQSYTTLGFAQDPGKDSGNDGGWTANAPDIVGSTTYPYLQYQFLSSNSKIKIKYRIEQGGSKALKMRYGNTVLDLNADGVPETSLVLDVIQNSGYKENSGSDYDSSTGLVTDDRTSYDYSIYFLPIDDDGSADANTRPNNTTISSGSGDDFVVYESNADEYHTSAYTRTTGNNYNASLTIYYALSPEEDLDGDGNTENYYIIEFDLAAYTNFATYMQNRGDYTDFEALSNAWPTGSTFYGAGITATQDNSINGDIGG